MAVALGGFEDFVSECKYVAFSQVRSHQICSCQSYLSKVCITVVIGGGVAQW